MSKFFFLNKSLSTYKDEIQPGPRILSFTSNNFNLSNSFDSIEDLVKNDEEFYSLKTLNSKRANLIIQDKYIIPLKDLLFVPKKDGEENLHDYILLLHTLSGKILEKKKFSGIHHIEYPIASHIIITNERSPDSNYVWKADIKLIRNYKEYTKSVPSTLFPKTWSFQRVYKECIFAIKRKSKFYKSENIIKYKSNTENGIPVEIIYDKLGNFKTIYPIYKGKKDE